MAAGRCARNLHLTTKKKTEDSGYFFWKRGTIYDNIVPVGKNGGLFGIVSILIYLLNEGNFLLINQPLGFWTSMSGDLTISNIH